MWPDASHLSVFAAAANVIVYRDLKPENILLDHRGHVKLVDFGFARSLDPLPPASRSTDVRFAKIEPASRERHHHCALRADAPSQMAARGLGSSFPRRHDDSYHTASTPEPSQEESKRPQVSFVSPHHVPSDDPTRTFSPFLAELPANLWSGTPHSGFSRDDAESRASPSIGGLGVPVQRQGCGILGHSPRKKPVGDDGEPAKGALRPHAPFIPLPGTEYGGAVANESARFAVRHSAGGDRAKGVKETRFEAKGERLFPGCCQAVKCATALAFIDTARNTAADTEKKCPHLPAAPAATSPFGAFALPAPEANPFESGLKPPDLARVCPSPDACASSASTGSLPGVSFDPRSLSVSPSSYAFASSPAGMASAHRAPRALGPPLSPTGGSHERYTPRFAKKLQNAPGCAHSAADNAHCCRQLTEPRARQRTSPRSSQRTEKESPLIGSNPQCGSICTEKELVSGNPSVGSFASRESCFSFFAMARPTGDHDAGHYGGGSSSGEPMSSEPEKETSEERGASCSPTAWFSCREKEPASPARRGSLLPPLHASSDGTPGQRGKDRFSDPGNGRRESFGFSRSSDFVDFEGPATRATSWSSIQLDPASARIPLTQTEDEDDSELVQLENMASRLRRESVPGQERALPPRSSKDARHVEDFRSDGAGSIPSGIPQREFLNVNTSRGKAVGEEAQALRTAIGDQSPSQVGLDDRRVSPERGASCTAETRCSSGPGLFARRTLPHAEEARWSGKPDARQSRHPVSAVATSSWPADRRVDGSPVQEQNEHSGTGSHGSCRVQDASATGQKDSSLRWDGGDSKTRLNAGVRGGPLGPASDASPAQGRPRGIPDLAAEERDAARELDGAYCNAQAFSLQPETAFYDGTAPSATRDPCGYASGVLPLCDGYSSPIEADSSLCHVPSGELGSLTSRGDLTTTAPLSAYGTTTQLSALSPSLHTTSAQHFPLSHTGGATPADAAATTNSVASAAGVSESAGALSLSAASPASERAGTSPADAGNSLLFSSSLALSPASFAECTDTRLPPLATTRRVARGGSRPEAEPGGELCRAKRRGVGTCESALRASLSPSAFPQEVRESAASASETAHFFSATSHRTAPSMSPASERTPNSRGGIYQDSGEGDSEDVLETPPGPAARSLFECGALRRRLREKRDPLGDRPRERSEILKGTGTQRTGGDDRGRGNAASCDGKRQQLRDTTTEDENGDGFHVEPENGRSKGREEGERRPLEHPPNILTKPQCFKRKSCPSTGRFREECRQIRCTPLEKANPERLRAFTLCGTPEYLPPEVLLVKGHDCKADCWALGILVYEMLVGQTPFYHENPQEMYENILRAPVPFSPCLSPMAMDLIERLLRKSASKRPSMKDLPYHLFFTSVKFDWTAAARGRLTPPFVPPVRSKMDTHMFDEYPESFGSEGPSPTAEEDIWFQEF
ncbi:putative protein kinase (incomplete catalytic triad) [Neospora caninum Liverpool]|uniref:AGC kinase n=1 Tax=Neospora caninum (strain Liverpool) TaxID=572307 RepID=F0VIY6_NEOCL|nr:putative protein kinase (incomplete catalytic triad) [Neospora caninum Liverpool]CBZ53697.1 putative protein kinase (incomplete catalytic triad) [Neospora caninum Liverpool]|eukprot:XP_003883729.1 putative protein kinase (incomplete catalytic triad) [Neospora caninum Liverpool]